MWCLQMHGKHFYHLKTLVPAVAVVCRYLVLMNATSSVQDGQSCVGIYYTCVICQRKHHLRGNSHYNQIIPETCPL